MEEIELRTCSVCRLHFEDEKAFREHVLSHQKQTKMDRVPIYECRCGVVFDDPEKFIKHTDSHEASVSSETDKKLPTWKELQHESRQCSHCKCSPIPEWIGPGVLDYVWMCCEKAGLETVDRNDARFRYMIGVNVFHLETIQKLLERLLDGPR